jgi:hypothetical protein
MGVEKRMIDNIILSQTTDGYDWTFDNGKLVTNGGITGMLSSITHEINIHPGEINTSLYAGDGCHVYEHMTDRPSSETVMLVREALEHSIEKVQGVRSVKLEVQIIDNRIDITKMTITRNDGGVVTIGK